MKNYIFYTLFILAVICLVCVDKISPFFFIPYLGFIITLCIYSYIESTTENLRRCYVWVGVGTLLVLPTYILSSWFGIGIVFSTAAGGYYLIMDVIERKALSLTRN